MKRKGQAGPNITVLAILVIVIIAIGYFGYLGYKAIIVGKPPEKVETFEHAYVSVIDAQTDDPVVDATVKLSGVTTVSQTTDSNGQTDFAGLPSGTYIVSVKRENYYWIERTGQDFTGTTTYVSKSYSMTKWADLNVDNSVESARRTNIDNSISDQLVELWVTVGASDTNEISKGTVAKLVLVSDPSSLYENMKLKSGGTLTTVKAGSEWTVTIGDLADGESKLLIFEVGLSGITGGETVEFDLTASDTPAVKDDAGNADVTKALDITVAG